MMEHKFNINLDLNNQCFYTTTDYSDDTDFFNHELHEFHKLSAKGSAAFECYHSETGDDHFFYNELCELNEFIHARR